MQIEYHILEVRKLSLHEPMSPGGLHSLNIDNLLRFFYMGGIGGTLALARLGASDLGHKVEICGDSGVEF
jgi:hypothetical protein